VLNTRTRRRSSVTCGPGRWPRSSAGCARRNSRFFFSSRRRHTISVSAFLLNRSSDLIQLTKLGYDATPFNQILKQNAKREMRLRLGKVTVADVLAAQPVTTNLLKFMRASIKMIGVSNLQSFIASMTQKLT